ncbi:MAG: GNAT family N-acetyltransferase [Cyanobacteria bacterium J06628_6]
MQIRTDDLSSPAIAALLREHLDEMYAVTPPEIVHVLDLAALQSPDITVWSIWENDALLGCGALNALAVDSGEIKSMRTARAHRRRGVAARMLQHIIEEAGRRAYSCLCLETGAMPAFAPAQALYARYGFTRCGPFGDYTNDPNSVFMEKVL